MRSWWFSHFTSGCQRCLAQLAEVVLESCQLSSVEAPTQGWGKATAITKMYSAITKGQIPSFSKGHMYLISSFSRQYSLAVQWQRFELPPSLWHH